MASSNTGTSAEKQSKGRKRKRNSNIPGFAPTSSSTPVVTSQVPRAINAEQFASARAVEIKNMVTAIEEADKSKGKRLFQTLPRHMRRRAMSHNVKRMPVRLRQRASSEMHNPANRPETLKKKSRRHRRQPKNLLEEYTRRQRKHVWLETHIWHAKRMKMIDAWGYRLADHPNDKGFRAAFRAVKNDCILQDMSYYGCIEVCGVQSKIIQAMHHLTSQEAGLTMAAKCYLNGMREGTVMLYKFDQFPLGAISLVSFLWRQKRSKKETATIIKNVQHSDRQESEQQNVQNDITTQDHTLVEADCRNHEKEANSQLWVWSHPASFDSVFDAITEACKSVGRTSIEKDSKVSDGVDKDSVINTDHLDQGTESTPLVNGVDQSELKVTSLGHDLLRLRLTGPQSHALLTNTLKLPADLKHKQSENKSSTHVLTSTSFFSDRSVNSSSSKWWQEALDYLSDSLAQSKLWDKLKRAYSPAVLPPRCVIALTVLDPRLYLPGKKKSIACATEEDNSEESDLCDETVSRSCDLVNRTEEALSKPSKDMPSLEHVLSNWPSDVAGSHIWDRAVRREVKETKMTEQELNRRRSELLVPSSQLNLNPDTISHIPVLLIQQPGWSGNSRDAGVGLGYGSGWDVILPSGWAMAFWIAFVYRGARTGALQECRTIALEQGVPFFPNDFPDTPAGEAHNKQLKEDGEAQYKRYPPAKRPNYDKLGVKSPFSPPWRNLVKDWSPCGAAASNLADVSSESTNNSSVGIPVAGASPEMDIAAVQPFYVLRSRSKLSSLRNCVLRDKRPRNRGFKHHATTSHAPSPMDDLSSIMKNDLNSLVCVWVRMINRNVPVPNSALAIPSTEDISRLAKCKDASGPVEPLHKGPRAQIAKKSLRNSCTREIVGFVSSGHFSLARGCGFGVGFCALPGLVKLLSSARNTGEVVVLVRGPSTQQYRFSYLTIL